MISNGLLHSNHPERQQCRSLVSREVESLKQAESTLCEPPSVNCWLCATPSFCDPTIRTLTPEVLAFRHQERVGVSRVGIDRTTRGATSQRNLARRGMSLEMERIRIPSGFGIYHDQPFGRMFNEMTSTEPFNQGAVITASNVSAYTPYNAPPYNGTYPNNGQVPPSPRCRIPCFRCRWGMPSASRRVLSLRQLRNGISP